MKMKRGYSILALALAMVMALSACASPAENSPTPIQTQTPNASEQPTNTLTSFKQSPILDGKDLPPVVDRLPKTPKVSNEMPKEFLETKVGVYGGTFRTITPSIDFDEDAFTMITEPLVNTTGILGKEVTPNVVEGFTVSDNQQEFTFTLREGLKWSDGTAVTMEDYKFTFEHVLFNKELTPILPAWLKSGGKPDGTDVKFEAIDDKNFKLMFDKPYGGFLVNLAIVGWRGYCEVLKPSAYLKQYHKDMPEFDQANFDKVAADNTIADDENRWASVFSLKDVTNWEATKKEAIGFPNLQPWYIVSVGNDIYKYERNPYYFKVDVQGNQLPYVDSIDSLLVQDSETLTMRLLTGEIDFCRATTATTNMPMYKENEKNGYKTYLATMHTNPDIAINMTFGDEEFQKVVQDKRFREALVMATDRDEIVETVFFGYAKPSALLEQYPYDVDKANVLLDEMGMDKRDVDGNRLSPTGKPFEILIETAGEKPEFVPMAELVVEMWNQVGVKTVMKRIDGSLRGQKSAANELQATAQRTPRPLWYQANWGNDFWGRLWNVFATTAGQGDVKGVEPPQGVKDFYDLNNKLLSVPPADAQSVYEQIKKSASDNIWYFTFVDDVVQPMIVNEKIGNVTDKGYAMGVNFAAEEMYYIK